MQTPEAELLVRISNNVWRGGAEEKSQDRARWVKMRPCISLMLHRFSAGFTSASA